MLAGSFALIVILVAVALIFDFLNGLHDAANSIATVVSTRVLSTNIAIIWAAFFNFIAFLFFGLHVAQTIGTGLIAPEAVDDPHDHRRHRWCGHCAAGFGGPLGYRREHHYRLGCHAPAALLGALFYAGAAALP